MTGDSFPARLAGQFAVCACAMHLGHACADSNAASGDTAQLEEVVVTAEKRSESLSKTPVAVTALSQEALDSQGVTGVEGLNGMVPNLSVSIGAGEPRPDFTIRGITSSNLTELGNPAIAFYVDGVYVSRPVGISQTLYDDDRIEVLRGPQGTLYGKSATSGSINVITAQPTMEYFYGQADASYGNYEDVTLRGMLNMPVSSTLAARISVISEHNDGYQGTDGTTTQRQDLTDQKGGRISALWKPADNLSWFMEYDYFRDTGVPSYAVELTAPAASGLSVWNRPISAPSYTDDTQSSYRTRLDWALNDSVSVAYVGGYSNLDRSSGLSTDRISPVTGSWTFPTIATDYNYSHEFDLQIGQGGSLHGLIGAFLFHELSNGDFILNMPPADLTLHYAAPDVDQSSRAVFAQTTYDLSERLHLTGGVRFTDDYESTEGFITYVCPLGTTLAQAPAICLAANNSRSGSWNKATWRTAVDYQASQNNFSYASISTGYKPGGFGDLGTPAYEPETVTNFEVGLKSRLFGGTVSLDNALFYMDYSNLQVSTPQPNAATGEISLVTENAAKATIYGLESEYEWLITRNDRFSGYIALLNATYNKYIGGADNYLTAATTQPVDLSGKHLIMTPAVSQRIGFEHTFDLAHGATLVPAVNLYWQTSMYMRQYNEPVDSQYGYSRTNLTLTYHAPKDRWHVEGAVYNIENRNVLQTVSTNGVGDLSGTFLPPRTYATRIGVNF
jgi:iron complex outermembrane recepter protein